MNARGSRKEARLEHPGSGQRAIKRLRRLTVEQYIEFRIVRIDFVHTQSAVDHVDQPVGRSDGVISVSAEDLLPSPIEFHRCLGVYGIGAVLTVYPIVGRDASPNTLFFLHLFTEVPGECPGSQQARTTEN
jgi:hypothetical protein